MAEQTAAQRHAIATRSHRILMRRKRAVTAEVSRLRCDTCETQLRRGHVTGHHVNPTPLIVGAPTPPHSPSTPRQRSPMHLKARLRRNFIERPKTTPSTHRSFRPERYCLKDTEQIDSMAWTMASVCAGVSTGVSSDQSTNQIEPIGDFAWDRVWSNLENARDLRKRRAAARGAQQPNLPSPIRTKRLNTAPTRMQTSEWLPPAAHPPSTARIQSSQNMQQIRRFSGRAESRDVPPISSRDVPTVSSNHRLDMLGGGGAGGRTGSRSVGSANSGRNGVHGVRTTSSGAASSSRQGGDVGVVVTSGKNAATSADDDQDGGLDSFFSSEQILVLCVITIYAYTTLICSDAGITPHTPHLTHLYSSLDTLRQSTLSYTLSHTPSLPHSLSYTLSQAPGSNFSPRMTKPLRRH
jgi:hypothetical protein